MKLTAVEVAALGPGDHPVDDQGLVIRVRASGARSWSLRYSFRGADRRLTIDKVKLKDTDKGLTLKQARNEAIAILARVARGEDPQGERMAERHAPPPLPEATIAELARDAMAHLELRPVTRKAWDRFIRLEIVPQLGELPVSQLTRRRIREWSERIAARAPFVANNCFNVLRRLYSVGVERDLVVASPFAGLKRPTQEKAKDRVLSMGELWALQRALDELTRGTSSDVVWLLLWTGVRREMALGARRSELEDLDGRDPRWIIPGERTKNGRQHVVPLSKPAVKLVRRRLQAIGPAGVFLFPSRPGADGQAADRPSRTWHTTYVVRLRKRVDKHLPKPAPTWTIHDLRRTLATLMRESLGIRRDIVELVLGHTISEGSRVAGVYDRSQLLKERRQALEDWAQWLEELPDPKKKLLGWKEADRG